MEVILEELLLRMQFLSMSHWIILTLDHVVVIRNIVVDDAAHNSVLSFVQAWVGVLEKMRVVC
jgi:hypothetical protein